MNLVDGQIRDKCLVEQYYKSLDLTAFNFSERPLRRFEGLDLIGEYIFCAAPRFF